MPLPHPTAEAQATVARHYASLTQAIPEGLGGKLLYTADLTPSLALIQAANIAGAATLAASSNPDAARNAMREGIIDFLVTSLDEALRILKNEIRKHQPVSVGITEAPETISTQIKERGVQPDLTPSQLPEPPASRYLFWTATPSAMPALETQIRESLVLNPTQDRWLKLSPRYLGRPAQKLHGIFLSPTEAATAFAALNDFRPNVPNASAEIGLI